MLDTKPSITPGAGKERLKPLEGGMGSLDHYYRSLQWAAAALLLPLGLALAFIYGNFLNMMLMLFPFAIIAFTNQLRGLIIILDPATGNATKAELWRRLTLQGCHLLSACFILVALAHGLLGGLLQVPLPHPAISRSYSIWNSLLEYALIIVFVAALTPVPFLTNKSFLTALSIKRNRFLLGLYVFFLVMVSNAVMSPVLGITLSLPFIWGLVQYLRYRAERDEGERIRLLDSVYAILNLALLMALLGITLAGFTEIMEPYLAASSTVAVAPALISGAMAFLLLLLLGFSKPFLHQKQIRDGMFQWDVSQESYNQPGLKQLGAWLTNRLQELSQGKPVLRTPRQLAWMRLVCWLGDRRWQAGALSSLAMVALVLASRT